MTDTFSKSQRSAIMKRIKSARNKSTEEALITIFRKHHITGWRRNYPVIGKPDFVFLEKKIAIFADGCFWHGHDCRNVTPAQNKEYWDKKRERNQKRDAYVNRRFSERGWKVVRFWECNIKQEEINLGDLF
jgi:DNA mismatch endonuclease (patch repair protein)